VSRTVRAVTGAALAAGLHRMAQYRPPGGAARWQRTNHRGRPVTLLPGPVLAVAAGATSRLGAAGLAAGVAAGAVGAYDDVAGQREDQRSSKGLRGHAAALAAGRVTAGTVKVAGIGLTGVAAARMSGRRGADVLLDGALVAGAANLLNLFDLRPGRALKVGLVAAAALDEPGPAAAAAVLLPADLAERGMLGDAGANGLGAVLGLALADRLDRRTGRLAALGAVAALTAASEVVSFTRVIDAVPVLRGLDRLGRLP
jgi:UDP-GlcNAc:undecaprenyl-phosphate/decaprenyl-phosphate GlcNAc-1-phosphate transferase